MKKCSGKIWLSISVLIIALVLPIAMQAAGIENIAFSKESSLMKEKYGVCEEFLDVKWMSKSPCIGILKANVYKNSTRETRYLIVYLEKPGSKAFALRGNGVFYDIDEKQYSSPDFAKFLSGARYSFNHEMVFMTARKGNKFERFPQEPLPFEARAQHENDFPNRSFSGFSKTVCIAYPDAKKAFVIEARKPFMNAPMDETTKQAFEIVRKKAEDRCDNLKQGATNDCNIEYLSDSYALDVNGDGKDDYIVMPGRGKTLKSQPGRYLLLSGSDGYVTTDVSGCLGISRFFYGVAEGRSFHLGRCSR